MYNSAWFVKYFWQTIMSENGYLSGDPNFRSSLAPFLTDTSGRTFLIIRNLGVLPQHIFSLVWVLPFEDMKNAFNILPTSFTDITGDVPWEADSAVEIRLQRGCEAVLSRTKHLQRSEEIREGTGRIYGLSYGHKKAWGNLMECPEAETCPTLRQGKEDFVYHTDQSDT